MSQKTPQKRTVTAVVGIIFNENGQILLTQRHQPGVAWHGKWQFPGGGIEYGEHPLETVIREVREESGVEISLLSQEPIIHSSTFDDSQVHIVLLAYPALYKSGKLDVSRDPETNAAKWYYEHEIPYSDSLPEVADMLEKAKEYLSKHKQK